MMHILVMLVMCMQQAAGPAAAPPAPSQSASPAPKEPPPSAEPPSLDDALGIGDGKKPAAADDHAEELGRSLDGAKPRDILASALDDMRKSARLLDENEAGLPTKRVQESVVRKLDELIATAQRMQQEKKNQQQSGSADGKPQQQKKKDSGKKQGGSEKEGADGNRDEPRENGQQRGGRDAKNQQADGGKRRRDGDANSNEPPENVDPTTTDAQFDESRAEWGRLPPRVREAVRQGLRDPMSAAYRRLTQDYYRRLAEEPKR
jgi:hypothetical protein